MVAKSVPFDWGNFNLTSRKSQSKPGAGHGPDRASYGEMLVRDKGGFYSYRNASAGKIRAADHDG